MKRLKISLGAVAAAGVATIWLLEHQAQIRLREQNWALQQQVGQLAPFGAEKQPSPRLIAQAKDSFLLSEEQSMEFLRLRGELGVLRQETDQLGKLRADNLRLHSNWVDQLFGGAKLSLEQVGPYLEPVPKEASQSQRASDRTWRKT